MWLCCFTLVLTAEVVLLNWLASFRLEGRQAFFLFIQIGCVCKRKLILAVVTSTRKVINTTKSSIYNLLIVKYLQDCTPSHSNR